MGELLYLTVEEFGAAYGLDYSEYSPEFTKTKRFVVVGACQPVYELEWMLVLDGFTPLSYTVLKGAVTVIAAVKQ